MRKNELELREIQLEGLKVLKKIKIDLFLDKNNKKRRKYKSFVE